jgi:Fe2+ transport system protein FeoA
MTVAAMAPGQRFVVRRVVLSREVGKRLADMGFTEGAPGIMVRKGAFRGPLHVRIRDYDVVLRRSEAAGIEAERVEEMHPVNE